MYVNVFVIRNVHKFVYDVMYCIGGRDRVEPEVTKGRIIRGKRIGGRDRVGPEVIEGQIIFYVYDIRYMDMIVYDIRIMDVNRYDT